MRYILIIATVFAFSFKAQAQVKPLRQGAHLFSIQWISFNKSAPGKVLIRQIGDD
ncbi:hypothetical protein SAMN06265348_102212 [Pedobacter westerhofensis]|uniref:Uncharacterized protein n=1 Tax=Pedobacter westerhofensis TaxID=425512 RepID=A0A521BDX3_9SPHI|nr:hypothetical protein [Pedobacter westerhofensis]SMO45296.1 hypothetical protein SAMN06265348_102212 [Pedobacter westerhofensis]